MEGSKKTVKTVKTKFHKNREEGSDYSRRSYVDEEILTDVDLKRIKEYDDVFTLEEE